MTKPVELHSSIASVNNMCWSTRSLSLYLASAACGAEPRLRVSLSPPAHFAQMFVLCAS